MLTLFDIKELVNGSTYVTDVKWDYFSCLSLHNDEVTKKIEVVKIGGYDDDVKVTIDFSKFMAENKALFNKLFKAIYTKETQEDLKAYKKDVELSSMHPDDIEDYLIFDCKVIDYMIDYEKSV